MRQVITSCCLMLLNFVVFSQWVIDDEQHSSGVYKFCKPGSIVSPGQYPTGPVDFSLNAVGEYYATESIRLTDGFKAHNFTNNGKFIARIIPIPNNITIIEPGTSVGKYEKLELGVQLSLALQAQIDLFVNGDNAQNIDQYTQGLNPYDPDRISIEAIFTPPQIPAPGGGFLQLPDKKVYGFYYKEFNRVDDNNDNIDDRWVEQATNYPFRVRFSPDIIGEWSVSIKIVLPSSSSDPCGFTNVLTFNCVNSTAKPYMRVGNHNRYFKRGDEPFFPVGQNLPFPRCWNGIDDGTGNFTDPYGCVGTVYGGVVVSEPHQGVMNPPHGYDIYLHEMELLKNSGANYFRMLLVPHATEIEFERLGNYDERMHAAWEVDRIIDKADELDLMVHFDLQIQDSFKERGDNWLFWDWKADDPCLNRPDIGHCYGRELGITTPIDFLTNATAKSWHKKRARYIISRWGYSNDIAIFELFSEVNSLGNNSENVDCNRANDIGHSPYDESAIVPKLIEGWHREYAQFIKNVLGHTEHLLSVSYAGGPPPLEVLPFLSDRSYFIPEIDVATHNKYTEEIEMTSLKNRVMQFHAFTGTKDEYPLENINKPFMFSEYGERETLGCHEDERYIKNKWAMVFTGAPTSAITWHQAHNYAYWQIHGVITNFLGNVDFEDGGNWEPYTDERNDKLAETLYLVNKKNGNDKRAMGVVINRTWNAFTQVTKSPCDSTKLYDDWKNAYEAATLVTHSTLPTKRLVVKNLNPLKRYEVQWFDGLTGSYITSSFRIANPTGRLLLEHPTMGSDKNYTDVVQAPILAFKLLPEAANSFRTASDTITEQTTKTYSFITKTDSHVEQEEINYYDSELNREPNQMRIVPNPAGESCTIIYSNKLINAELLLFNNVGSLLLQQNLTSNPYQLNISELNSGVYHIMILSSEDKLVGKLIKL